MLTEKVLRGGAWIFSLQLINKGLGFVRKIILAHLLTPNDFGLMGAAVLAMGTLEALSETGLHAALIQKRRNLATDLDTAWTISALRGLAIFLILLVAAPYIAAFFRSPDAAAVIRVIGLAAALTGFRNIGIVFFDKELAFRKQFLYELCATLTTILISISLALLLHSVWALVWGSLAAAAVRLIASFRLHPYRPNFNLNLKAAAELLGFGKWLLFSGILVFLINQGDDILVGRMLGVASLGIYQMAFFISNMPTTEIANVIARVTYPAYAQLQAEIVRIRSAYRKVLLLTIVLSMLLAGLIWFLSEDFIRLFLGDKWLPMLDPIHILVFAGFFRSIAATTGPLFRALGYPRKDTLWQSIRLAVLAVLIYPFARKWGIEGVCAAVLLSISISTFGFLKSAISSLGIHFSQLLASFFVPVSAGTAMVLVMLAMRAWVAPVGIAWFLLMVAGGLLTYLSIILLGDRICQLGLLAFFKTAVGSRRYRRDNF